jgi:hypothetical protein
MDRTRARRLTQQTLTCSLSFLVSHLVWPLSLRRSALAIGAPGGSRVSKFLQLKMRFLMPRCKCKLLCPIDALLDQLRCRKDRRQWWRHLRKRMGCSSHISTLSLPWTSNTFYRRILHLKQTLEYQQNQYKIQVQQWSRDELQGRGTHQKFSWVLE